MDKEKVNFKAMLGATLIVLVTCAIIAFAIITDGRFAEKPAGMTSDGFRVYEDEVTEYVQSNRKRSGFDDDDDWKQWLILNGDKASDIRKQGIDHIIRQHLIEKEAERLGITVPDDEVDERIANIRGAYGYDDDGWSSHLSDIGYTEESYRQMTYESMVSDALEEQVTTLADGNLSNDAVMNTVTNNADTFKQARRLSCIVMRKDESDTMSDIKSQLDSDPSRFDELKEENSETSLFDGWDITDEMRSQLTEYVEELDAGKVSDIITLDTQDVLVIARCDEAVSIDGDLTSLRQLPDDLVSEVQENMCASGRSEAFTKYVDGLEEKAGVTYNDTDITSLPYYVDTQN